MSYNSIGPDLSFFDKKMKVSRDSRVRGSVGLDEQTSQAQIQHRGYVLIIRSAPIYIDAPD
jgi:hypothetical protein